MYEGMVGTSGLTMWSRNDETRSVGPLQPLTIPMFFLWSFLRKYMCLFVGCRYACMCLCSLLLSCCLLLLLCLWQLGRNLAVCKWKCLLSEPYRPIRMLSGPVLQCSYSCWLS